MRRDTKALTLTDSVLNADRYGSLVESLGVTQTPSIVLIDRNGKARLVEGYVDAESLVQVIADARDERAPGRVGAAPGCSGRRRHCRHDGCIRGRAHAPPQPRGGSRFITDVVVEMGFLARDRVEPMVNGPSSRGARPSRCCSRPARSPATSWRAPRRSASGFTTWTSRCSRRT